MTALTASSGRPGTARFAPQEDGHQDVAHQVRGVEQRVWSSAEPARPPRRDRPSPHRQRQSRWPLCTSSACALGPRHGPPVIVVQTRYGTRELLPPAAPPPGKLEQIAGLLVHHASRTNTGKATRLLACNLKVTAQDDQDLRALRSDLGRLARQSPVPEVVTQSVAFVEAVAKHPAVLDRVRLMHASSSRREVHYDVDDAQLARAVAQLTAIDSAWDGRLQRIKQLAEALQAARAT